MSSDALTRQMFNVTYSEPLAEETKAAGVIAIDDRQTIEIIAAEPDFAEDLELAASTLNGSDKFLVHLGSTDDMSRAVSKHVVRRDAEGARDAVIEVLRQKYRFRLTPAA